MRTPLAFLLMLSVPSAMAAGCSASTGGCQPTTCETQGFQCGSFVDVCGTRRDCGTCAIGTCTKADGTAGFCQLPGTLPPAGNPDGSCSQPLPPEALPEDTSTPTSVVGTGTAASCTYSALAAAVARGGVVTFDCGPEPVTIPIAETLAPPVDRDTVIDGGNRVTLDGRNAVRILRRWNPGWMDDDSVLTLQHLVLANGKATGTDLIPTRPAPCSQGYNDGQGGAVLQRNGVFRAVDVSFLNNQAATLGPDTGGGAIYLFGLGGAATISRCSFIGNRASNAGALGGLFATHDIYDSLFDGNEATGHDANNDDPTQCGFVNPGTGQHQVGSGGNGGAIYSDGVAMDVNICGTQVRNNRAGPRAFGAAVFFTSNDPSRKGTLRIRDSLMFSNWQEFPYWQWKPGISTNASTPEPIDSDIR